MRPFKLNQMNIFSISRNLVSSCGFMPGDKMIAPCTRKPVPGKKTQAGRNSETIPRPSSACISHSARNEQTKCHEPRQNQIIRPYQGTFEKVSVGFDSERDPQEAGADSWEKRLAAYSRRKRELYDLGIIVTQEICDLLIEEFDV